MPDAALLAGVLALVVVGVAVGRLGSSFDHSCDATPAAQCVAPNAYHIVSINVGGSYLTQIRWVMANDTSVAPPIQMVEFDPSPPNCSDVLVGTITSPVQALAWTQCGASATCGGSDSSHTRWCTPQLLYDNLTYEAGHFASDTAKRYIACHELGHSIGLRRPLASEPQATCMRPATISPKYVPTYTTTSTTERGQIASFY